jgi:hypothetical protein
MSKEKYSSEFDLFSTVANEAILLGLLTFPGHSEIIG